MGNDLFPEAREAIVPDEVAKQRRYGEGNQCMTGPFLGSYSSFSFSKTTAALENLGPREGRGL